MNVWYDELNHKRETSLLGYFGTTDDTQNTVFCLFEPDAEGLTADSFPTEDSVYFGTRPGKRYAFFPEISKMSEEAAIAAVTEVRRENTRGLDVDPEKIERIVWEFRNVQDGESLAKLMDDLATKHPARAGGAATPVLPVMPDLKQALDIAAADSRAVIVIVQRAERDQAVEDRLARLAFENGIAGRTHLARLTAEEWALAKDSGQIEGGSSETGVMFVAPDTFGLKGEVWAEIPLIADEASKRTELTTALARFQREWRKLDRKSHIQKGVSENITWSEYDPDTGEVIKIEAGSSKLGLGTEH